MNNVLLRCENLCRTYQVGPETVVVFDQLNLQVSTGDLIAIEGTSGAGKSTLLHLLAGLDLPTSGDVFLQGQSLSALSERARSHLRNRTIGFVFQFHHLLQEFTALENVLMPKSIAQKPNAADQDRANDLLNSVGLGHRCAHKPSELSGGERQRVAIARALMNQPQLVLMDEPTGNLDARTADQVQSLLFELNRVQHCSFIVVTHNTDLAQNFPQRWRLDAGQLEAITESTGR
jgi:lipoprotein-releasing system ATP-binding protein